MPTITVMYPTGLAVKALAAPLAPIVVKVEGEANVKSPKMIGRFKIGLFGMPVSGDACGVGAVVSSIQIP